MTAIPFGEWRPDEPVLGNSCLEAKNVVPKTKSYGPLNGLSVVVDSALDGECRGAASFKSAGGDVNTYAGTDTTLYTIYSGTLAEIGRSADYSGSEFLQWRFTQFGDYALATNGADKIQRAQLGSAFSDIVDAPTARYLGVIKDYLLTGYVNDDGRLVKWSGRNDLDGWTAAVNGSGEEVVEESGLITGVVGGDPSYIFCEYAIWRVQWIGGDVVLQFDRIENSHGCQIPGSLVAFGRVVFYYASDGFYVFDGATEVPIGDGKVDEYFAADFDSGYPHRVSASLDPVNNLYVISYPGSGNTAGAPNKALFYNYKTGWWSRAEIAAQVVFPGYTADTSLEEVSALFASLELVTPSLDSPTWRGGDFYLGVFDSSNKLSSFTGSALEAILSTGDVQHMSGNTFVSGVYPLVDVSSATMRVGRRQRLADSVSYTSATAMQTSGRVPVRARGWTHRYEVTIPAAASWTHAQGVRIAPEDVSPAGRR